MSYDVICEKCECGHWDYEHTIFTADKKRYCSNCKCQNFKPIRTCVGCLQLLDKRNYCINPNCPINGAQN